MGRPLAEMGGGTKSRAMSKLRRNRKMMASSTRSGTGSVRSSDSADLILIWSRTCALGRLRSAADLLLKDDRQGCRRQKAVFVHKCAVGVQYLQATIREEQRQECETLVEDTVGEIESGLLLPNSGVPLSAEPRTTCASVGLCLDQRDLARSQGQRLKSATWLHRTRQPVRERLRRGRSRS